MADAPPFIGRRRQILEDHLHLHQQHQQKKTLDAFWPIVVTAFKAEFPQDDPPDPPALVNGKKPLTLRKRIKQWYNNSRRRKVLPVVATAESTANTASDSQANSETVASVTSLARMQRDSGGTLDLLSKPNRKLPEQQYYMSFYWPTHVAPFMEKYEEYKERQQREKKKVLHQLPWRVECANKKYEQEPEPLKVEIRRFKHLQEQPLEDLVAGSPKLMKILVDLGILEKQAAERARVKAEEGVAPKDPGAGPAPEAGTIVDGAEGAGAGAGDGAEQEEDDDDEDDVLPEDGDDEQDKEKGKGAADAITDMTLLADDELLRLLEEVREIKTMQRERAIHKLESAVSKVMRGIVHQTGYTVSVLIGGPNPAKKGDIDVVHYHSSPTRGVSFFKNNRDLWNDTIVPAFKAFLEKSTEESVRSTIATYGSGTAVEQAKELAATPVASISVQGTGISEPTGSQRATPRAETAAYRPRFAATSPPIVAGSNGPSRAGSSVPSTPLAPAGQASAETPETATSRKRGRETGESREVQQAVERASKRRARKSGGAEDDDSDHGGSERDADGWGPVDPSSPKSIREEQSDEEKSDEDGDRGEQEDDGPSDWSDPEAHEPWDLDPKRRHYFTGKRLSEERYKELQLSSSTPRKYQKTRQRRILSMEQRARERERTEKYMPPWMKRKRGVSEASAEGETSDSVGPPRQRIRVDNEDDSRMHIDVSPPSPQQHPTRLEDPDPAPNNTSNTLPQPSTPARQPTPTSTEPEPAPSFMFATPGEPSERVNASTAKSTSATAPAEKTPAASAPASTPQTNAGPACAAADATAVVGTTPEAASTLPATPIIPPAPQVAEPIAPSAGQDTRSASPPQPSPTNKPRPRPRPIPKKRAKEPESGGQPEAPTPPSGVDPIPLATTLAPDVVHNTGGEAVSGTVKKSQAPVSRRSARLVVAQPAGYDQELNAILAPGFDGRSLREVIDYLASLEITQRKAERDLVISVLETLSPLCEDERWQLTLKRYAYLECQLGFPPNEDPNHKLSTTSRPVQCAWWMRSARRKLGTTPKIKKEELEAYGASMRSWFKAWMPSWRSAHKAWPLSRKKPEGETWARARRGGGGGVFVAVIAVGWWLNQASTAAARKQAWAVADDLLWALGELADLES